MLAANHLNIESQREETAAKPVLAQTAKNVPAPLCRPGKSWR
jgi:hypothetical protein